MDEPETWMGFERLARSMAETDRKLGHKPMDDAAAARALAVAIEANRSALRTAEEIRTVLVRPMATGSQVNPL